MATLVSRALVFTLYFACSFSVGCMSRYQTSYGEYRPENPKFTLYPDRTVKQFDSTQFKIAFAFDTILATVPGPYLRDVLLFSEDQRFASIAKRQLDQNRDPLIFSEDPWLIAYQVGFYTLQNNIIKVEYFTNFQGGQYHTFIGVISENGKTLRIFQHYQGLGKNRDKMNAPHRSKLRRISQALVRY